MQAVLQNLESTFEGKETEHNWSKRHEACRDTIPTLCKSDAAKENPARLAAGIRHIIDGLMTCAKSERTQLSNEACKALQEVSKALGHNISPMIDIILPPLVDICGFTKPVSQKHGSETVEAIIRNAGYHQRLLHYVTSTLGDKRKPPRVAAAKWLKVFVSTYRHDIDKLHTNLDSIDRSIVTGLGDTQKDVREAMRATYWNYSKYWSARAESLMGTLPKAAQTALVADAHNPDRKAAEEKAPAVNKKSTSEQTRAFILAQKKKKLEQTGSTSASDSATAASDNIVETPQNNNIKARDNTVDIDRTVTTAPPTELHRMPSGLLAEPARRRVNVAAMGRPTSGSRPASTMPPMVMPQPTTTTMSRPTSASSAMPPPVASVPASRPVSVASTAVSSNTSSATVKVASRKPLISKQRLDDIMTKPLEGADEENKENERAHGLTDKREWARKETAEVSLRSISPLTKDPAHVRKLIARGIKGISDHTIDDVGYRKLQGVIKEQDNIFTAEESKYDGLLLALFNAIEIPDTTERTPLGRKHDSTFQMLIVLRLMLKHNQKYFSKYYPRAMSALITTRGNFEARSHIVSGLEQTAEEIVRLCKPSDIIDAVLMTLELSGKPVNDDKLPEHPEQELLNERGARSTAMGLHILSGLISRAQETATELDATQEDRMAMLGIKCLRSTNVSVKRAVIEYCVKLHEVILPETRFYELLTNGVTDLENLIEYYVIASKSSARPISAG